MKGSYTFVPKDSLHNSNFMKLTWLQSEISFVLGYMFRISGFLQNYSINKINLILSKISRVREQDARESLKINCHNSIKSAYSTVVFSYWIFTVSKYYYWLKIPICSAKFTENVLKSNNRAHGAPYWEIFIFNNLIGNATVRYSLLIVND